MPASAHARCAAGRMTRRSTVSRATAARSTVASLRGCCISRRPATRSWETSRVIRSTSLSSPALAGPSSSPSIRARRMASGVRSSWAALVVKRRCSSKPSSIRCRAVLIVRTSGRISAGTPFSARRTSVRLGSISAASAESRASGRRLRRMVKGATRTVPMKSGARTGASSLKHSRPASRRRYRRGSRWRWK